MEFLPRTMGTRPRVAIELRPEGVVAGRAEDGAGVLGAISRSGLGAGAIAPGLRAGNIPDRSAVSSAIRRALDGIAVKGGERSRYVTLVVPDAAVRVLLLDFDALPGKAAEALAVVRFRLKKLLPFDAEHAVVSYQVMSSGRDLVRVLAVAIPCDVLAEYEGLVTEAGYLPGSVLPSTLAAIAGLDAAEDAAPALVVNAGPDTVTTAIVRGGVLLLHRNVDMRMELPADGDDPGHGDPVAGSDPFKRDPVSAEAERQARLPRTPFEESLRSEADDAVAWLNEANPVSPEHDVTQAVSVAAAYFEDTLGGPPAILLSAGTLGADRLAGVLDRYGMDGIEVRELVDAAAIAAGASTARVPRGWLAGIRGALRS